MLTAAFLLLFIAVLLGSLLAVLDTRTGEATPQWWLAVLHGTIAIGGFAVLALALQRGPVRGLDQGTATFGMLSAWLLGGAALMGLTLLTARLSKRRLSGLVIGLHAMAAVTGFVVLAAYYFAG